MLGRYLIYTFVVALIAYEFHVYLNMAEPSEIVGTASGKLQGKIQLSRGGRRFSSFSGIPYAEPPVGNGRFAPPQPVKEWEGVKEADEEGIECMSRDFVQDLGVIGQEDCLILNVFTSNDLKPAGKNSRAKDLFPVIVYIHGGGFLYGSSKPFQPHYFMDKDVVLVTLNYRLGALGFLNTGDTAVRGNLGLKDQNLALKWVNRNIQAFGGDPRRITLMGESAGAVSVHLHVLSPLSTGLFQKAILLSGHALVPWAIVEDPVRQAQKFGEKLNCPYMMSSDFVNCLRRMDAKDIIELHGIHRNSVVHPLESFGPTVETIVDGNSFLTKRPAEVIKREEFTPVPLYMGVNDGEGVLWVSRVVLDIPETKRIRRIEGWYEALPFFLFLESLPLETAKAITNYYFGVDSQDFDPLQQHSNFSNLFSDWVFYHGLVRLIDFHRESMTSRNQSSAHSPIFLYFYTYQSDYSLTKIAASIPTNRIFPAKVYIAFSLLTDYLKHILLPDEPKTMRASHADELSLLFNMGPILDVQPSSRDYPMSEALINSFVEFASGEKLSFHGKTWNPVGLENPAEFMRLDEGGKSQMIPMPFKERLEFWQGLGM